MSLIDNLLNLDRDAMPRIGDMSGRKTVESRKSMERGSEGSVGAASNTPKTTRRERYDPYAWPKHRQELQKQNEKNEQLAFESTNVTRPVASGQIGQFKIPVDLLSLHKAAYERVNALKKEIEGFMKAQIGDHPKKICPDCDTVEVYWCRSKGDVCCPSIEDFKKTRETYVRVVIPRSLINLIETAKEYFKTTYTEIQLHMTLQSRQMACSECKKCEDCKRRNESSGNTFQTNDDGLPIPPEPFVYGNLE